MKNLVIILFITSAVGTLAAQTLTIGSGATIYVNRNSSTSTTPMLYVSGAVQNNGTLTDAGSVQTTGNFTNNNTFTVNLGGSTLGTHYDQLSSTGVIALSGTLNVVLVNGYTPTNGTSFTIIDGASLTGTFSTINYPSLAGGLSWSTSYDNAAGTVILSATSVLPVELLDFRAQADPVQHQVLLNWHTALEDKTESFTVERSRNGQSFTTLHTQPATGNNSHYTEVDKTPFAGINYYRLKIADTDGKMSYSKVISVLMGDKTYKIKAFPTLVTDNALNLTTDGGEINYFDIVNAAGQLVWTQQTDFIYRNGLVQIELSHLSAGVYLLRARNTEGNFATIKFVKQ
jgi:hypothetical protein